MFLGGLGTEPAGRASGGTLEDVADAYLADWRQVRDEFVVKRGDRRPNGEPLWADLVAAYAETHRLAALEPASGYAVRGALEPRATAKPGKRIRLAWRRRAIGRSDMADRRRALAERDPVQTLLRGRVRSPVA